MFEEGTRWKNWPDGIVLYSAASAETLMLPAHMIEIVLRLSSVGGLDLHPGGLLSDEASELVKRLGRSGAVRILQ